MSTFKKVLNLIRSNKTILKEMDKTTPEFSLAGKIFLCKVVDIYDGDSCKVVFKHARQYHKWNIRMYGYDSPEIRISRKAENREYLKKIGLDAKNYLIQLIGKEELLYIKCGKFDKYGRLLGDLYYTKEDTNNWEKSINKKMIDDGQGYPYEGGKKISFI